MSICINYNGVSLFEKHHANFKIVSGDFKCDFPKFGHNLRIVGTVYSTAKNMLDW